MKKLLLFLLLIPTLALSQVSSWRGSNSPTIRMSTPSTQSGVSSWRSVSPREYNRPVETRPGSNIIVRDPWGWNNWGWNRWDMWGAPAFGWNFWQPMWYWNDWGYRQPARVYVYKDGKRDTIRGKKPIINFGIQKSTDKQIGGFFTMGNRMYFIGEFNSTYERDRSTFFPYGNITQVDFPLIDDHIRLQTYYVGIGKRIKRTGIHLMVGGVSERVRWRGRDDVGEITFPKYTDRFMTVKFGAIHDFKNITFKVDYDPILENSTFGLGLNF
jgi:hypothetical protein